MTQKPETTSTPSDAPSLSAETSNTKRSTETSEPSEPSQLKKTKSSQLHNLALTLQCPICLEIFVDPVSAMPCLHSFCSGCYVSWHKAQNRPRCPTCRVDVSGLQKNHLVANLCEAMETRTKKELASLRKKSEGINELLGKSVQGQLPSVGEPASDEQSDDNSDYDSESQSDSDTDSEVVRCRECDGGGTFTCAPSQEHLRCSLCYEWMASRDDDPSIVQKCALCSLCFCHAYRGCPSNIRNPFSRIQEHTDLVLPSTTAGPIDRRKLNDFELEVIDEYIKDKDISPNVIFQTSLQKLIDGQLQYPGLPPITAQTYACKGCAKGLFSKFLYDFRISIPADELPSEVRDREDCWYGWECRTQHHRHHASRLNHMCDKTRR